IAKSQLLIIDDWGLSALTEGEQRDLLEILDDRHNIRSTIICGQLPVEHWPDILANPTLADAILDRLVHNAYKINLKGESMRKKKSKLTE
ncbi:MAG: ATP-binding protein, partial [bacterium]|nr:ATP-binding protein [bacterium]